MAKCTELLGKPPVRDIVRHDDGETTIYLRYDDPEVALAFDIDLDSRLSMIEVCDPRAILEGRTLIGTEQEACLALIENDSFRVTDHDEVDDLELAEYACDDDGLVFWFEVGRLESINMFPRYDLTGDTPMWPDSTDE